MALDEILGMNARNFLFIREFNSRDAVRLVDNKLKTKRILRSAGLPVPETYKVFRRSDQVRDFDFASLPASFVIKPNSGFGGRGILVVYDKTKNGFLRSDGGLLTIEEIRLHILDILEGVYSLSGLPDIAFIEERIKAEKGLRRLAYRGLPDIRVIVFNLVPVMAMLRLPTEESRGRSNLHEGAMGVGIDLSNGLTLDAFWRDKAFKYLPKTKIKLRGKKIKFWSEILLLASEAQVATGAKFLGVDIALSEKRGPIILELNIRPGLSIQSVNQDGLKARLEKIKKIKISQPTKAINLGKELFRAEKIEELEEEQPTIGLVEVVEILHQKNNIRALAKIDTGADISAIDFSLAEKLGLKDLSSKARTLRDAFRQSNHIAENLLRKEILKFPEVRKIRTVKSSLGEELRVMVRLKLKIASRLIDTNFYLTERSGLKYKLILGRIALKQFLVDPLKYTSRLHPFRIKKLDDVRPFFALYPRQILGIGVNAFNRLGPESWIDNYTIVALRNNLEDEIFDRSGIKIFSAEKEGLNVDNLAWNSQALLRSPNFLKFIDDLGKSTAWFIYSPKKEIENYAAKFGATLMANPYKLYKKISDKDAFRNILDKLHFPYPRSEIVTLPFDFKKLSQKLGLPLFVQLKAGGGGRGNFVIKTEEEAADLARNFPKEEVLVNEYISGFSPSITGCVTRFGIFYLPPQIQILDQKELIPQIRGTGQFCGHDFSSDLISEDIKKKSYHFIKKIGESLKDMGFKGIFGLDLLWDKNKRKLYIVECNPRLLGVHPTQTLIQQSLGEIPLSVWHMLEFLKAPYEVNYEKIQAKYLTPKIGAHLLIHNLEPNPIEIRKSLKAGTYSFDNRELKFERAEHNFSSLKENEFILTDGVSKEGRIIKDWKRMIRIITKNKVLNEDLISLNDWTKEMIEKLKDTMEIKSIQD